MWQKKRKKSFGFCFFSNWFMFKVDSCHWWHSTKITADCRSQSTVPNRPKLWLLEQCFTCKLSFSEIQTSVFYRKHKKFFNLALILFFILQRLISSGALSLFSTTQVPKTRKKKGRFPIIMLECVFMQIFSQKSNKEEIHVCQCRLIIG